MWESIILTGNCGGGSNKREWFTQTMISKFVRNVSRLKDIDRTVIMISLIMSCRVNDGTVCKQAPITRLSRNI